MNLHWSVYLIVGLLVTIVSVISDKMILFVIIGIIFMFIGMSKFITGTSKFNSSTPEKIRGVKNYVKCKNCSAWNYPHSEKCHYCGKRI